jgi:hypothetical protein
VPQQTVNSGHLTAPYALIRPLAAAYRPRALTIRGLTQSLGLNVANAVLRNVSHSVLCHSLALHVIMIE